MERLAIRNIEIMISMASRQPNKQPEVLAKIKRYIKMLTDDPKLAAEYQAEADKIIKTSWKTRSEK